VQQYKYVAYTSENKLIEGDLEAASKEMARDTILRSGHRILTLQAARSFPSLIEAMPSLFGVKLQDVIVFSRLLATLLERGTDILVALELLKEQVGNRALQKVVSDIIHDLKQGDSFSQAVGKHPRAFPSIYRQMIKVGEEIGALEMVLRHTAEFMDREKKAAAKVGKAFVYPAFVLVAAIAVVGILMTVALPSLMEVFTELDADLPASTKILMNLTGFFSTNKVLLLCATLGIGAVSVLYGQTSRGRRHLNILKLKLPIFGRVNLLKEMCSFARATAMMLKAGVTMTQVMELAVETADNQIVREALEGLRKDMIAGKGLSGPMEANPVFPSLMVQITKVGEEVGSLDEDMEVLAVIYTEEIENRINKFISLLQPTILMVMGLLVAFIAVSVVMPMYTVMQAV
jgi:type IV pilus assembly protein PilC